MLRPALLAFLVGLAAAQGPVMQSCSWRLVPYNTGNGQIEFAEVTCTFDQALYVTAGANLVKATTLTGMKVSGSGSNVNLSPEMTYYLGGAARLCCGTTCAAGQNTVWIGPSSTTSFLNFLGSLSQINLPSSPSPNTLTFFVVFGFPGQPAPAGALSLAGAKACASLKLEYGYQTMAACQTAFPNSACGVKSQAGVAAALNQMATLGAETTGTCSPAAVKETITLMNQVLDRTLPNMNDFQRIGNIEQVMGGFLSSKSLVACSKLAGSLFTLRNVTRPLTGSRDCPYDYETQKAQYDKDPCCAWFSTKCCAPRTVSRTFTEIASVVFASVNSKCPTDVSGALGNLRLIAQDINQRATETTLGFIQLYDEYSRLSGPISTCLSDGFFGYSQKCTKNGDCWSEDCDMSNAQNDPNGKGRCQPSEKPYEDFLKCIYSATGLRPDIQRQLAADMGVTSVVRATRVSQSAAWLLANEAIQDCVGKRALNYQAKINYGYDASGNWKATITPANAAGCVAVMGCNHGFSTTKAACEAAPTQMCARCLGTYCYDVSWRYKTQAACLTPKCKLPNEWHLRELPAATCQTTTACSQTCEKCVSGWPGFSNNLATNYCFVPEVTSISCPVGATRTWAQGGAVCYFGDMAQANCTAQNGTYTSCMGYSKAQCDQSTAWKNVMRCRWDQGAACTPTECSAASKGECNDWNLQDYSCTSSPTCGRCVKPFPNVAGTMIVNDSWSVCQESTTFTRYMRTGCGAPDQSALNSDSAACTAAGGALKTLATTQAQCEADKACIRWRSSRLPMTQAQCTECSNVGQQATWGTMYQWTTPTQLPGQVVNLLWLNKKFGPVNKMVTTVPYINLQRVADTAVIKVLGRVFGSTLRKKYSTITQAYARLSCNCLSGGTAADTAECTRLASEPVKVIVETCNCDASGACDDVCPFACATTCSYNVTRYPSAGYLNNNALRRRRRLQAGWAIYETIKDAGGNIIGQTIGNANAYAGIQTGQVNLCLTIDQLIPQSPAYTLYDFAKGDGVRNAPGAVMGLTNLMPNGDQLCATVPAAAYPYWPIKKLPPGGTRSPTSPTTPRPAAPTTAAGGRVKANLVVLAAASLAVVAFW